MAIKAKLRTDLRNLQALRRDTLNGTGAVADAMDDWRRLYSSFTLRRFDVWSRGGGDWPPLRNPRRKKKNRNKILVLTGFMRARLAAAITVVAHTARSITFALIDSTRHPDADMPVDELMAIHDQGLGLPQRRILVAPDATVLQQMREAGVRRLTARARGVR
jgi:hypothetical protein